MDGSPITHELKEEIDEYIESKVKPEGMFPHAHFSTEYKNSKDDETYPGVRDFVEHFRGILTWDLVHKKRMDNWDELQLKKAMGPGIPKSETEKAKKSLYKIQQELKEEEGKGPESNNGLILKLRKQEKEMREFLRIKNRF